MSTHGHILPRTTPLTEAYWDGCRRGELRLQHCLDCGHVQLPPRSHCTRCRGSRLEWRASAGRGRVASFTWIHIPLTEAWASEVPYAVALVRLDEGPLMMTNLHDCSESQLTVGLEVTVTFEARDETIHLPQFRPAREEEVTS
ncbi:MAG: Zn-ribbon domain-containing OB-fold protein [Gammaproteobacteria bacterium]|nr:Zn-ribbon domain-containing OB-fold protein [Gammaproteobacteria bacterium]